MHKDDQLLSEYRFTRVFTEKLCEPLLIEDYIIQSCGDVSPPKWHLAHTTWFFETFLLQPYCRRYKAFDPIYHHLFNSYYQQLGTPYPRIKRGLLARPTVQQVYDYRRYVDGHVCELLQDRINDSAINEIIKLGIAHEQQHQELLLMDIKHNFFLTPDFTPYLKMNFQKSSIMAPLKFIENDGGRVEVGYKNNDFSFDNERPSHQQILRPYAIADRLITNGEFADFIAADGYRRTEWWLADGWDFVLTYGWQAPLYWLQQDNEWLIYTLNGLKEMDPNEPVVHVSFYEAYAFACYKNHRLPTEVEWEHIAQKHPAGTGNFLEDNYFHPCSLVIAENKSHQFFGDAWEWTASPYTSYPGFKAAKNALGEYNGKFMSNQMVLRGGSCVTPRSHIRSSYRNFFQPEKQWQFGGIRLAYDL